MRLGLLTAEEDGQLFADEVAAAVKTDGRWIKHVLMAGLF
jgi:hypothetical protein